MMSEFVVVYGTLKQGFGNHVVMDRAKGTFISEVDIPGYEMYSLGAFPAVAPAADLVHGELYEVEDMEPLDRLEGFPHLYNRQKTQVYSPESNVVYLAWIYFMEEPPSSTVVESGTW